MSDWCFSLRQLGGSFSSEGGSDTETSTKTLAKEEETVEYQETPWSIAKINAATRLPSSIDNQGLQRLPPRFQPPVSRQKPITMKEAKKISFGLPPPKSQHVGPLFDGFRKQAELGKTRAQDKVFQKYGGKPSPNLLSRVIPPTKATPATKKFSRYTPATLKTSKLESTAPVATPIDGRTSSAYSPDLSFETTGPPFLKHVQSTSRPKAHLHSDDRPAIIPSIQSRFNLSMAKAEPLSDPPDILESPSSNSVKASLVVTPPTSSPLNARSHYPTRPRPLTLSNASPMSGQIHSYRNPESSFTHRPPPVSNELAASVLYSPHKHFRQPNQGSGQTDFSNNYTLHSQHVSSRSQRIEAPRTPAWMSNLLQPQHPQHEPPELSNLQAFPSPSPSPPRQMLSSSPVMRSGKRDAYQFGEQDDSDATWSTLPRKKPKVDMDPIKRSGAFTLRGIGLNTIVKEGKTGMKADDKRRVITFLPPPPSQR